MSIGHTALEPGLQPMVDKRPAALTFVGLLSAGTAYWLWTFAHLLTDGHRLLGTDSYGAVWGVTVANVVHLIGISHVGIAVSATVRILRIESYRNFARIAEVMTLVAMGAAVLNIAIDVGRPDRFITHTLLYGRWQAPMVWSMTVITVYLLLSSVYLYLALRRDLSILGRAGTKLRRLYFFLALRYRDTAETRRRHEQTLRWLAVLLVPIMVSVHSVYGLIFGLLPAKPGWFSPLQAPYFVLGAIVSGFSALVIVAFTLRRAYGWQDQLPERAFKVSGAFLAFVVFLYLYFQLSEHLTAQYATLPGERAVSQALLTGKYATPFWLTTIVGLVAPFLVLAVQSIRGSLTVGLTVSAAVLIHLATWVKRLLLVVPAQYEPHLPPPRPLIDYVPTGTELVLTFGTYAIAAAAFLLALRVVPMVELTQDYESPPKRQAQRSPGHIRAGVMLATFIAGALLVTWGLTTRDNDYAPLKWVAGAVLLALIPLENCLVPDGSETSAEGEVT
jgi:molybdopterin-containing oxidoreductase family membrane subunit